MSVALVIQIVTAALQLGPLAASTIAGVKKLISQDPNVPADLSAILLDTANDNQATLAAVQAWLAAHPA